MTVNTSLLQKGYQSLAQQRFFELPWHKIVISPRNIPDICKGTRAVQQDAALQTHLGDCSSVRQLQWCCCCTDSVSCMSDFFFKIQLQWQWGRAVIWCTEAFSMLRSYCLAVMAIFVSLSEKSCFCRFITDMTAIRSDSQPPASLSVINNTVTNHGLYFQNFPCLNPQLLHFSLL